MRALLYARYSTTLQSSLSIDDQLRVCSELCEREGWPIAGQHCDAAISGAVRDRPGLNALLADVRDGDVVVAESLDRLSRDLEDTAAIWKRIRYAGARIWTLDGEVGEELLGLRGTISSIYRRDVAAKVRRGLTGRALAGMNPGGMAYGYRKVPKFDDRGEPVRGLRVIDEDQAAVIRRIFAEYASGRSARAIAERLNAEGVPSPSGGLWRASTVHGDRKRRNGILQNDLYRGELIYNLTRRVTNPATRKREIRLNPQSEWKHVAVPELRIVSDSQWEAAVAQRRRYAGQRPERARRPKRLLSGKAECGVCGASWRIVSGTNRLGGRWGCSAHHDGRGCSNGTTITGDSFERRVLRGLSQRLLDPELVEAYAAEWQRARTERLGQTKDERRALERRRAEADRKVKRLVAAIADGLGDLGEVGAALRQASAERDRAEAELREVAAEKVVALHPGLAAQYRRRIASLLDGIDRDDAVGVREAIRALVDRIVVSPRAAAIGTAIEVHGLLSSIITLAGGKAPECPVTVVPLGRVGRSSTLLKIAC